MKKRFNFIFTLVAFLSLLFSGCKTEPVSTDFTQEDTIIDGSKIGNDYAFITYSLSAYKNQSVTISFSADMKVENNGSKDERLMWQVNINSYPVIAEHTFKPGTSDFIKVSGSKEDIQLGADNAIYLSTYQTNTANLKITLKNVKYTVTGKPVQIVEEKGPYWCDESVASFKDTYSKYFEHVGFAVTGNELTNAEIQKGLKKHADTTTMGNEFKPDFVFAWALNQNTQTKDFTASNGKTIKVPSSIPAFTSQDQYLNICKTLGIKMRGHVLVWHSQTPAAFFRENYNQSGSLVDEATMTARQEWYIKTVLEHVKAWEEANNNGEHIIWAWDVVNEAVADGSSGSLRDQGSDWYSIYKSDEFIVNAFRFANKYAPKDVLLCYNDYNCTESAKRSGMLKILDDVIKAKNDSNLPTRIDVMGMQSHINKYTTTSSFEQAVKDFTSKGLDVHVTELDIGTEEKYDSAELARAYGNMFKTFIKNRKTASAHGISSVTIWGINDETTWLNSDSQIVWHGNVTQYPLLFAKNASGKFVCKEAFDAVIAAAE